MGKPVHAVTLNLATGVVSARDLTCGQFMKVVNSSYSGEVILRTFEGFVSITNPGNTWDRSCILEGVLLPKGTTINVVVGA